MPPDSFLGEVRASGNSTLLFQTKLAEADWTFYQSTVAQNGRVMVRGSGVMVSVDAEAKRIELGAKSAGVEQNYILLEQSPEL